MAEDVEQAAEIAPEPAHTRRRWPMVLAACVALLLIALGWLWNSRDRIADRLISDQLAGMGLPATYRIEKIGPGEQVLRDLVVGDPRSPDLTIERVTVAMETRWGIPWFGRITLLRPRLHGSYRDGKLSFGSLDKVLFRKTGKPFRLPDLDLAILDGRGRMDTDFGAVGVKVEGAGRLRHGFSGRIAAVAPSLESHDCRAEQARLTGKLTTRFERPRFTGPLRVDGIACTNKRLARSELQIDTEMDPGFDGGDARLGVHGGQLAIAGNRLGGTTGNVRVSYRKRALNARYDITGRGLETPQASMAMLAANGVLRAPGNFQRVELEGDLAGSGFRPGQQLDATLAQLQRGGEGTLAEPLAARMRSALQRETRASRLSAAFILRRANGVTNLVVPQASLRGASGRALVSVSRLQLTFDATAPPLIDGNFYTGGVGLPQLAGKLERGEGGGLVARLAMDEYRAGDAGLAIPHLALVLNGSGGLGLAGEARLSGGLPGGEVRNLALPLNGNWSEARGLAMWRRCMPLRFDSLALASLKVERRSVTLCPPAGSGAILRSDARGTRIAAGAPSLDISGRLASTPIRILSGPIGFALPGNLSARSLQVALGPAATASHFRIADLTARIGKELTGNFADAEVRLAAVPLDLVNASGTWRLAGGRLAIEGGQFRLEDRQIDDRFQPLSGRGGELVLADNRISAKADLFEPASGREVVRTIIRHDLSSGRGDADLMVDGLTFDRQLQPETVTRLALGVVANTAGTVRGAGHIAWTPERVTSTGRFSSNSLNFAAAFGPVKGLSGTVVFTDLLGMVTAPDQRLHIASINPGIEVNDGDVSFELRPASVLVVNGATWPFVGGTLRLEPTRMVLGTAETRRYTLSIEGLDAARFVQRLELGNVSATGTFDGRLPLVFDQNGGRVEEGQLLSRPPGGNLSYVGELTYKDLSAMANLAFDALRSIDYRQMRIDMNGALEGEIITRISLDGLSQGLGARKNYVTRQIAKLPIRFRLNIRAPFFGLATSIRSLYDPTYTRDPRELGLVDAQGRPLNPPPKPPATNVQPPVSDRTP